MSEKNEVCFRKPWTRATVKRRGGEPLGEKAAVMGKKAVPSSEKKKHRAGLEVVKVFKGEIHGKLTLIKVGGKSEN